MLRPDAVVRRLVVVALLGAAVTGCRISGAPSLTVLPEHLPNGAVGQPYEVEISATYSEGGLVDFKSLSTEGNFPPGLTVRSTTPTDRTAAIEGTPTAAGTYEFTLRVGGEYCTMAGCPFGTREYTVVIAP